MADKKKRFVPTVGWITPKFGFCWVNSGANRVRKLGENGRGTWGSRKFGKESVAESRIDP